MAYKQKGCTPITAKIQKTTKGGVTNPLLKSMGVPMKKNPSMAKQTEPGPRKRKEGDGIIANFLKDAVYNSTSEGKAYNKNKRESRKAKNKKELLEARAKVPNKSRNAEVPNKNKSTKSDSKPKANDLSKMKQGSKERYDEYTRRGWAQDATTKGYVASKKPVSKVKTQTIKKAKVEKTPEIKISAKATAKPTPKTKKDIRVENRTNKKSAREENRANRKATREENKANRKAARNGSPAKQTMQQQNRKEKREANRKARRVAPKKGNAKMAKKAKVYGK